MMTVQVLKVGQQFYYTEQGSDDYYTGHTNESVRFVGSGMSLFGITDEKIATSDARLKNLLDGFSIDGATKLRKGAGQVRKYHFFTNAEGEKLTYRDTLYLSESEVSQIKSGDRSTWGKRLQSVDEFKDIDASWLHVKNAKTRQLVTLVNPETKEKVAWDRVYTPNKYEVSIIKTENYTNDDVVRKLSYKCQQILTDWNIEEVRNSFTTEKRGSRPGADCTFSATKDFSLLWALAPDKASRDVIESCWRDAVKVGISYLEENVYIRKGAGGRELVPAKTVFAVIPHATSRAEDPQIHDHVLNPNVGITEDGQSGAIEYGAFFKCQFAAGQLVQNEARKNVEERLGLTTYDIRRESNQKITVPLSVRARGSYATEAYIARELEKNNRKKFAQDTWGIQGITKELRDTFSKRTKVIKKEQHEGMTYAQKQAVVLKTRDKKDRDKTPSALFPKWRQEAAAIGFTWNFKLKEKITTAPIIYNEDYKQWRRDALRPLCSSEMRKGVTEAHIVSSLCATAQGRISSSEILEQARHMKDTCFTKQTLSKEVRYTFNDAGIRALQYRTFNEKTRALRQKGRGAIHYLKYASLQNKALGLLITGKISHSQYNKIVKPKKLPKNALLIKFMQATGQISWKHMRYELTKLDREKRGQWKEKGLQFSRFDARNVPRGTKRTLHLFDNDTQARSSNPSTSPPNPAPTSTKKQEAKRTEQEYER